MSTAEQVPERSATAPTGDAATGLTSAEVAERVAKGLVNDVPDAPSRTIGEIIRANVFTRFNALIGSLWLIVMICGAYRDALFGGVVLANTLIGVIQELRAKRTLDALTVVNAPNVQAVRDGKVTAVAVSGLVLDDVMDLVAGQQIVADSVVLEARNLEVDESLLTGESEPVVKKPGDELLAGSFVVAGQARGRVTKVGADAYAAKLAEEARKFSLVHSDLRVAMDRIVTLVTYVLIPTGIALFLSQLLIPGVDVEMTTVAGEVITDEHGGVRDGLVAAVGGVVAMVPEGLILLTSVAFTVGIVRLARRRTLVNELPAIEVLARVDVICLDKTGTITSGAMNLAGVELLESQFDEAHVDKALAALAWSDPNPNATQTALQLAYPQQPGWTTTATVAFSSARKWSSTSFEGEGTWIFGAPEMVMLGDTYEAIADPVGAAADEGKRVLILAHCADPTEEDCLPDELSAVAMVMLEDEIRPDAAETLAFFAEQGVILKVISGDNPRTVGAVGRRVGLAGAENLMDARELPTDESELADVLETTTVFGRVTPHQKRAMVQALQSRQHVVAMTGDGVNDVLALKDADCGIAMASGSEATRAVAQLVLLDSSFSALPRVLAEGRRVINNIERVASLFLVKTTYAMFFALATVFSAIPFPFLPRHLTLIGTFTIGVPAFFLALAPNSERVKPGFIGRVLRVAVPGGLVASIGTFVAYIIARNTEGLTLEQERTTATLVLAASAVLVLIRVAAPLVLWKVVLIAAMAGFLALAMVWPPLRDYFELVDPPKGTIIMMGIVLGANSLMLPLVWKLSDRLIAWGERRWPGGRGA